MITSAGIGSGLDIEGLITQLVTAEGQPAVNRLDQQEAGYQAELSGLGLLSSALSQFQSSLTDLKDLDSFQPRTATSSDESVFTASASNTAVAGEYQIQVLATAEAQKLSTAGFADSDAEVGTGTLTFTINGESFDVIIDENNKTLAGIRDAVNEAGDNTGVSATIVNVDDGFGGTESRLVLTATQSGTDNTVNVTVLDDDGDSADANGLSTLTNVNLTELNAAVDAQIEVDGQSVTRSSNTINDAIEGVTLELEKADIGTNRSLSIELDKSSLTSSVNEFIAAYNSLGSTVAQLSFYDAASDTAGVLLGDATLRNIDSQVSLQITQTVAAVTGGFNSLSSIGITTNANGDLELDSEVFDAAVDSNFDDIGTLFADETDGIAVKLDSLLSAYLDTDGILNARTEGLQTSIDEIDESRERLSDRLIRIEARYRAEFTALDALVANFQATSDFLTQQLADLPGFSRNES
ncbi:MAG: flagellar filament capping protein FliD [Pseudomonadota bacterium]